MAAKRNHHCTPKAVADSIKNQHISEDLGAIYGGDGPPALPEKMGEAPKGKERGFITTLRESETTAPELAQRVSGDYEVLENKKVLEDAQRKIDANPIEAENQVLGTYKADPLVNTMAMDMIRRFQNAGDFDRANRMASHVAKLMTEAGQSVQVAAMWGRMTPEGALRYVASEVNKLNEGNKNWEPGRDAIGRGRDVEGALKGATPERSLDAILKDVPPRPRKEIIARLLEIHQKGGFTQEAYRDLVAKKLGLTLLDKETAKAITDKANEVQRETDPEKRRVLEAELKQVASSAIPVPLGKKIATVHTMAMLLNPKTTIRNVIGNKGMLGGEYLLTKPLAATIDAGLSLVNGKRTTAMPSYKALGEGFIEGAKAGIRDVKKGIDTSAGANKFELSGGEVFRDRKTPFQKAVYPFLNAAEKALGFALRVNDRAIYEGVFKESLVNQMKAAKVKDPAPEMLAIAHAEAAYSTFQNESYAAKFFSKTKQLLNIPTGGNFGLGDFIIKFPKTPGNILSVAMDYSPIGFVKVLGKLTHDFATHKEFDQRTFVHNFSRAIVGTVGIGAMGYILGKAGVVTGNAESDVDIAALKRTTGMGPNTINASGLGRLLVNLFTDPSAGAYQDGDTVATYDWAQPFAVPFAAFAQLAHVQNDSDRVTNAGKTGMDALQQTLNAADTLTDQPMMKGIRDIFTARGDDGKPSLLQGVANVVSNAPASFVPSLLNQTNQLIDNTPKETSSPNLLEQSKNKVLAKIPGLAQTLPDRYDTYGRPAESFQGKGNNLFNVFLNPAFVSKVDLKDPTTKEVLRLFDAGFESQAPKRVSKSVKITLNGKPATIELSTQQLSDYQKYVGSNTKAITDSLLTDPIISQYYTMLGDEQKAEVLSSVISSVDQSAKVKLFGSQLLSKPSALTVGVMRQDPNLMRVGVFQKIAGQMRTQYRPKSDYSILGK